MNQIIEKVAATGIIPVVTVESANQGVKIMEALKAGGLLAAVVRAGEWHIWIEDSPEVLLRQVTFLPVNHLRTQDASQVLLKGVARAGEGIMVSPAHPMCPTGTFDRGQPRR